MNLDAVTSLSATTTESSGSGRLPARPKIAEADVHKFVHGMFASDLHARRVLSIGHVVLGVVHGAFLTIHAIGQGMAQARGLDPKHAIKQVDRMLANKGIDLAHVFPSWVRFVTSQRMSIMVTLDWTDFDDDDQTTIALNMVTSHGRATPLLWKTIKKSDLKDRRNGHEDALLELLREILPRSVKITVLADRGFGDQKRYAFCGALGIDYVIRFKQGIHVTDARGRTMAAKDWVPLNGHVKTLRGASVTADKAPVPMVVCVKARGMKEAWCLVTSRVDLGGAGVVKAYAKRFTTEENFRDTKDIRFGLGLSSTHIGDPHKRDRLLLICALAQALLTLLGAAAERIGLDRRLKASTTKKRTLSLFRQGLYWYGAIPMMRENLLEALLCSFEKVIREHAVFTLVFGDI